MDGVSDLPVDPAQLERALTRAVAGERARLARTWRWLTVAVVVGVAISIVEPKSAGVAVVLVALVVIPTFVRHSTIRPLERADDWVTGTTSVHVEGFWIGAKAVAATRVEGRPPLASSARRSDGRYPTLGAELDGYISRTQRVMVTHDGRVYRLPDS